MEKVALPLTRENVIRLMTVLDNSLPETQRTQAMAELAAEDALLNPPLEETRDAESD